MLNAPILQLMGTELLTIRVALDPTSPEFNRGLQNTIELKTESPTRAKVEKWLAPM
jgi:hypothetical protein